MQISSAFIANIQDIYKEAGLTWLKHLPALLDRLCQKRGLRFLTAMPTLTYNFVGLVEVMATKETAIIKMAPTNEYVIKEAKWLERFHEGVAKVFWIDEEHHAFLMEHLIPGKPLKTLVSSDDDQATRIICQTIRTIHAQKVETKGYKHLSELAHSFVALEGRVETSLLSQAKAWFADLTQDKSQDVLLHGDLHHDNILSSNTQWKAIDPHGYVGDPAFEVGPMIYNPGDCFPHEKDMTVIIERRLKILTEELRFDAKRIKAWTFCMSMLSIAWTVEDHGDVPAFELMVANIIDKVKI
ncbi:MAG: phosphotransferase [Proteobacteria bacterium]|nr:phosphotransferase [Pseudomonadota bacterium]